jgi:hypothetical protein
VSPRTDKTGRPGLGWWIFGAAVTVLAVLFIGGPLLLTARPDLAERLETVLQDGWAVLPSDDGHVLEVDRAVGFVVKVRVDGEPVADEAWVEDEGILTVFDGHRRIVTQAPLLRADHADWSAFSPWPRLGAHLERQGRALFVRDVADGGPAAAAGLRRGDLVTSVGGRLAAPMAVRAALIYALAGGEVELGLRRPTPGPDGQLHVTAAAPGADAPLPGGADLTLRVPLQPLMPAAELAGVDDIVGAWSARAAAQGQPPGGDS